MILQCPKCKSYRIIRYSKSKYLNRLIICLILAALCVLEFYGLLKEPDVDRVVLIGLFGSPLLFLLSFTMAVNYFIKVIKTKETIYVCRSCKSKLKYDEMNRNVLNDEEILLEVIRKRKHSVK